MTKWHTTGTTKDVKLDEQTNVQLALQVRNVSLAESKRLEALEELGSRRPEADKMLKLLTDLTPQFQPQIENFLTN